MCPSDFVHFSNPTPTPPPHQGRFFLPSSSVCGPRLFNDTLPYLSTKKRFPFFSGTFLAPPLPSYFPVFFFFFPQFLLEYVFGLNGASRFAFSFFCLRQAKFPLLFLISSVQLGQVFVPPRFLNLFLCTLRQPPSSRFCPFPRWPPTGTVPLSQDKPDPLSGTLDGFLYVRTLCFSALDAYFFLLIPRFILRFLFFPWFCHNVFKDSRPTKHLCFFNVLPVMYAFSFFP